jgi:hypothetical protein
MLPLDSTSLFTVTLQASDLGRSSRILLVTSDNLFSFEDKSHRKKNGDLRLVFI